MSINILFHETSFLCINNSGTSSVIIKYSVLLQVARSGAVYNPGGLQVSLLYHSYWHRLAFEIHTRTG